ncbi:hypothetical protein NDU88_003032 [Pleurodeles waltl]|uniref:Uncharacterized protein n=1 Tax=Pleurodeles waltl TaxID=8319 RepID=A0AAV7SDP2_PLEWA|nr:hypothetical protein NDU88_003032 [Pleurodeles waltl]
MPRTGDTGGVAPEKWSTEERGRSFLRAEDTQGDKPRSRGELKRAAEKPDAERRRGYRIPHVPRGTWLSQVRDCIHDQAYCFTGWNGGAGVQGDK